MGLLEFLRFTAVGGVGFAVDGGLMLLLIGRGHDVFHARLVSFAAAVTATWALNRAWTFSTSRQASRGAEYLGYFAVQLVGAGINLGCFFLCLQFFPAWRVQPLVPLFVGAIPALIFNFTASRQLVFRNR